MIIFWGIELVTSYIEIFSCCMIVLLFLRQEKYFETKRWIVLFSGMSALLTLELNRMRLVSEYATLFLALLIVLFLFWICRRFFFRICMAVLGFLVIDTILDGISLVAVSYLYDVPVGTLAGRLGYMRISALLLSKSLLTIVMIMLRKINIKEQSVPKKYFVFVSLVEVFFLIISFILIRRNASVATAPYIAAYLAFILAMIILIYSVMFQVSHYYEAEKRMSLLALRNRMLEQSLKDTEQSFSLWKKSVHDYKHHVLYLRKMVQEGKWEAVEAYLGETEKTINAQMFYVRTGNDMVDTVLNLKKQQAEEHGILFIINADVTQPLPVREIHMVSVLGNLLDNAIEASQKGR